MNTCQVQCIITCLSGVMFNVPSEVVKLSEYIRWRYQQLDRCYRLHRVDVTGRRDQKQAHSVNQVDNKLNSISVAVHSLSLHLQSALGRYVMAYACTTATISRSLKPKYNGFLHQMCLR